MILASPISETSPGSEDSLLSDISCDSYWLASSYACTSSCQKQQPQPLEVSSKRLVATTNESRVTLRELSPGAVIERLCARNKTSRCKWSKEADSIGMSSLTSCHPCLQDDAGGYDTYRPTPCWTTSTLELDGERSPGGIIQEIASRRRNTRLSSYGCDAERIALGLTCNPERVLAERSFTSDLDKLSIMADHDADELRSIPSPKEVVSSLAKRRDFRIPRLRTKRLTFALNPE
jgi:hypothetical protein